MKGNNTFAIIWDMDGTMADTREAHWLAWKEVLSKEKYDLTWETFLKTFGQRNDAILRSLLGAGLSDAEVVRIGDAKEHAFREALKREGVMLLPGAGQLLDDAKTGGWPQAIVSSAPRMNITAILEALNLSDTFAALICAEDVSQGKPHPEGCLTASLKLGVLPANCIVIEDAPAGLEAARLAGMACVGVLSTHDHLNNADLVVNNLDELSLAHLETLVHEHKAF